MFLVKLLTQVKIIIDYYCEHDPLSSIASFNLQQLKNKKYHLNKSI